MGLVHLSGLRVLEGASRRWGMTGPVLPATADATVESLREYLGKSRHS